MRLDDLRRLLEAEVLTLHDPAEEEVVSACGSDMMSDVLAFVKDRAVLLTGLVNPQVIRTAMMMDMPCIVFVRGKHPSQDMIDLAEENRITLMSVAGTMFETCGRLYEAGLGHGERRDPCR